MIGSLAATVSPLMKLGPLLLLYVLLIGVSLYLYDSMRTPARGQAREPASEHDAFDPLQADAPEPRRNAPFGGEFLEQDGGADAAPVRELLARVESLEGEVARLRRQLASGAGGRASGGGDASAVPAMEMADPGDLADPSFDDRAVAAFEVYLDEVNRRKAVERQRGVIEGQIKRLELNLSPRESVQVIDETLAYHKKISELYRVGWPKDEGGREERRVAFQMLHEDFKGRLERLVNAAAVEKITQGRIGRNRGFISGSQRSPR